MRDITKLRLTVAAIPMVLLTIIGAVSNPTPPFIVQEEGSNLTKRNKLNFVGTAITCADNGGTAVTDCTLTGAGYATVMEEGSGLTQRATVNFIGNGFTCVDDAGNTRTNCTLTDAGSGAAGVVTTGTQTLAGAKTLSSALTMSTTNGIAFGASTTGFIANATALTPDGSTLYTGTTSNSWHGREFGDAAFDHANGAGGTAALINPGMIWHDKDQNATDYQTYNLPGISGKFTVTLTESSATDVLIVPVADNTSVAGTLQAKIFASDGTVHQVRSTLLRYVATNEAGTEVCVIGTADGVAATNETDDHNLASIPSGTLTTAWTCTAGTATVVIAVNAVTSLTQTVLSFEGQNFHVGAGEPLPQ